MLDYKIMYVSRTGNTQRLAVCIYQSLQQLGNGDIEEINCNTEPGKSHRLYVGFCVAVEVYQEENMKASHQEYHW